jgi:hypothetical protein
MKTVAIVLVVVVSKLPLRSRRGPKIAGFKLGRGRRRRELPLRLCGRGAPGLPPGETT